MDASSVASCLSGVFRDLRIENTCVLERGDHGISFLGEENPNYCLGKIRALESSSAEKLSENSIRMPSRLLGQIVVAVQKAVKRKIEVASLASHGRPRGLLIQPAAILSVGGIGVTLGPSLRHCPIIEPDFHIIGRPVLFSHRGENGTAIANKTCLKVAVLQAASVGFDRDGTLFKLDSLATHAAGNLWRVRAMRF